MAVYNVTSPDGRRFRVTAPDGTNEKDLYRYVQSQIAAESQPVGPVDGPQTIEYGTEASYESENPPWWRDVADVGVGFVSGVNRATGAAISLGSYIPGVSDYADKGAAWFNKVADTVEEGLYSDRQKEINAELGIRLQSAAEELGPDATMGEMIDNMIAQGGEAAEYIKDHPTQIVNLAIQSVPYIFGGGLIVKGTKAGTKALGLKKISEKLENPITAAATGESLIVGGQAVSDVIAETDSAGEYSAERLKALWAIPSTAIISSVGGRVANRAGIGDIDVILGSGGAKYKNLLGTRSGSVVYKTVGGGLIEGAEEFGQGAGEQMSVNYAAGKNLLEDVGGESVIGAATGMGQGAGVNLATSLVGDSGVRQAEKQAAIDAEEENRLIEEEEAYMEAAYAVNTPEDLVVFAEQQGSTIEEVQADDRFIRAQQIKQQEAELNIKKDLRIKHKNTMPDESEWIKQEQARRIEQRRIEVADETTELGAAFIQWQKDNDVYDTNPKAIDAWLEANAGSEEFNPTKEDFLAAFDAHVALQEAKATRTPEEQAEVDNLINIFLKARKKALDAGDMLAITEIEREVSMMDPEAFPEFATEWLEAKRNAAVKSKSKPKKQKEEPAVEPEVEPEVEAEAEQTPVTEAPGDAGRKEEEITITEQQAPETYEQQGLFGVASEAVAEEARPPSIVFDENPESDTYGEWISREEETEVTKTDQAELFVPNPFERNKYRTVKGKKVISKKWQRFEEAIIEFGRDMQTVFPELHRAIKNSVPDRTYENKLTEARDRKEIIAAGAKITGTEATPLGQVQLKGQWQQKMLPFLMEAANRNSLEDYMWWDSTKTGKDRVQWRMSAISNALGLIDPKTGEVYTPKDGKKLVNHALKAYRAKQIAIGEANNIRETMDRFNERMDIKLSRARKGSPIVTDTEEAYNAAVDEFSAEVEAAPQTEEDAAAAQDFATQREGVPSGVRIQDRISDTGVGAAPAFTPFKSWREEYRSDLDAGMTPEKSIALAVERLNKRIPILKRAATLAEKKSAANPQSAKLKEDAVQKRKKADKAIRERESIEDFKEDSAQEIRDEYEGTPTPELLAQREAARKAITELAEKALKSKDARAAYFDSWNSRRSKGAPAFGSLSQEDKVEWIMKVMDAYANEQMSTLSAQQRKMERRVVNDKNYSEPKTKSEKISKGRRKADTGGKKRKRPLKADRKKDTEAIRKPTIKEASAYAKEKLGRNWRTAYPRLPKLLRGKGKNLAAFNRLVDKYAEEIKTTKSKTEIINLRPIAKDEYFSPAINAAVKERFDNMFRKLIGEKNFRKIQKRVLYFNNTEEAIKAGWDPDGGAAFVSKSRGSKGERLSGNPDTIVFILNKIPKGAEASVFMHEVGSHIGLEGILSKASIKALKQHIEKLYEEDLAKYGDEPFYNLTLQELLDQSDGVIADNPYGTIVDSDEHFAARYAVRGAMQEGYIDKKTGKIPEDSLNSEVVAYFIDTATQIGITPSEQTETGRVLKKFRDAVVKFLQSFIGGADFNLNAQNLVDMAYGAAKVELERGTRSSRKILKQINAIAKNMERRIKAKTEITQRTILEKTEDELIEERIEAFINNRYPKNDKNKYVAPGFLPKEEWRQFQISQGRAAKKLRAKLREEVARRKAELEVVETKQRTIPEPMNSDEKNQSKKETKEFRNTLRKIPVIGDGIAEQWDNITNIFRKGAHSVEFLHTFIDKVKDVMPAAAVWHNEYLAKEKTMYAIKQAVDGIAVRARQMSPLELAQTNNFIAWATVNQKWGYDPEIEGKTVKIDLRARIRFDRLNDNQQQMVKEIFAHGERMLKRKQAIANNFNVSKQFFGAAGLDGPYAPLKRFGNYVTELKSTALLKAEDAVAQKDSAANKERVEELKANADHYIISFFDTEGQANRFRDEQESKYEYAESFERQRSQEEGRTADHKVLQKVLGNLGAAGLDAKAEAAMKKMITDMYLQSLDDTNARQSQAKRKGTAGYETNMVRSFLSHAGAEANLIATMEHGQRINAAISDMVNEKKQDEKKLGSVYNMIIAHYNASMENKQTRIQDRIAAMNTVYMLTSSVGYHLTNATQPQMVTIPMLAGDFGKYARAQILLGRGYRIAASGAIKINLLKKGAGTEIDLTKIPDRYKPLLEELQLRQLLDVGMEQDLSEFTRFNTGVKLIDGGSEKAANMSHKLYQVARLVEAYNRVSAAVAAYDLASENPTKLKRMGMTAHEYAIGVVENTQGNFSTFDAPLAIKKLPKLVTQYRKYQIMMGWVYAKAAKAVIARDSTAGERWVGLRTLGYLISHAALFSGVRGLPGMSLMAPVLFSLFGEGEDDEPQDIERTVRTYIQDEKLASLIARGIPSWFGWDMSTKIGQQDIFSPLPFVDFGVEQQEIKDMWFGILGPTGNTASNFARSVEYAREGNTWRSIEYAIPKGFRHMMESYRLGTEGYTLRNGDLVGFPEDFSNMSLALTSLGIPASEVSHLKWTRGQQYEIKEYFGEAEASIRSRYVKAHKAKDVRLKRQLLLEWNALQRSKTRLRPFFNNNIKELRIVPASTLIKAPIRQYKRELDYRTSLGTN